MAGTLYPRVASAVLAFVMALFTLLLPAASAAGQATQQGLPDLAGKSDEQRQAAYGTLTFAIDDWEKGTIVAEKPLAIVTYRGGATDEAAARLSVWTGIAARVDDDLITLWDELYIDRSGKVIRTLPGVEHGIPGYFAADSQLSFRTAQYAGAYPWADVPTDQEASQTGAKPFPNGEAASVYGTPTELSTADGLIKPLSLIPAAIPVKPYEPKPAHMKPIAREPLDIRDHWARSYILDLMAKGIISGYEDGTIRPNLTLTRAEFVKLLADALQLEKTANIVYQDTENHWAKSYIAAVAQVGIARADESGLFRPNDPITRLEMMEMLQNTLQLQGKRGSQQKKTFTDTKGLTKAELDALQTVTSAGLVQGYQDGSVHPQGKLKRAEAFVVIAKLLALP
ncbi:MAG TPA: S-layer homology domain-containing protein [Bacilli bacterium]